MAKGERRRGGLAPAMAPRMPVNTEDVRTQIEAVNATILPRGTVKINVFKEEEEHTGIKFTEPATNLAVRQTIMNSSSCSSSSCSTNNSIATHRAAAAAAAAAAPAAALCKHKYMPGVYDTYIIIYQVLEVFGCEATRRQPKKRRKKIAHEKKKKRALRGPNPRLEMLIE